MTGIVTRNVEPLPAPVRMHGEVGDVDLVADLPEAQVPDETPRDPDDHRASDSVLRQLVPERAARPRRLE